MRSIYIIAPLTLALQGCAIMGSKQLQKQQDLWQNIGRMSAYIECQQQLLGMQAQSLINLKEKQEVKENIDVKPDK